MSDTTPNDSEARDIRPVVAPRPANRLVWVFAAVAAFSAGLLFYTLDARRTASRAAVALATDNPAGTMISSPPDIQIPADGDAASEHARTLPQPVDDTNASSARRSRWARDQAFATATPPQPSSYVPPMPPEPRPPTQVSDGAGGSIVFNAASAAPSPNIGDQPTTKQAERVSATIFQNPATTIPLGTVIQAVLETALDSNRAGFARALVSRDVYGFDGTRILVPKGSLLIGEYKADLGAGQNRALIQWQRLMRPDGVIIDIDSPSADPLGRAGIRGKVNSHFLERFGGAILRSTLDIGVQLATRRVARDTVVLALPGTATGTAAPTIATDKVQRTLTVKQGTSVSVFVSRDLDFTSVAS